MVLSPLFSILLFPVIILIGGTNSITGQLRRGIPFRPRHQLQPVDLLAEPRHLDRVEPQSASNVPVPLIVPGTDLLDSLEQKRINS